MKKTIIAAAVAASFVAPVAMAEVKISGMINPEFIDKQDVGFAGGASSAAESGVNTDIVISASEDLGNGLKVTGKYHQFVDTAANAATTQSGTADTANADMSVTVSGDFGSIAMGRFESFTESKMDAFMSIDASHDLDLEDNTNEVKRSNNNISYVSPSMNGLTVSVMSGATNSNKDFSGMIDAMVQYSNNGLTIAAAQMDVDGGQKINSLAAAYKMGDLEVRVSNRTTDSTAGVEETDTTMYGVKYTMGANTVAVAARDSDYTSVIADAKIFSVSHALSKSTNVYVTVVDSDTNADDATGFGIAYKF
jgi:hypothetical protein